MGRIEDLHLLIERENIILDITENLPENVDGIYLKSSDSFPIIGINCNIVNDKMKYSLVLAEELGHHFTSVGDSSVMFNSYSKRLILDKSEIRALKWATEYILPLEKLKPAFLKMHNRQIDSIYNELEVPHEFLLARLKFLSHRFDCIDLDENTALLLTTLPNIYTIANVD